MPTFIIHADVELELDAPTIVEALEWCENHTVFDMLNQNAAVLGPGVIDPETGELATPIKE